MKKILNKNINTNQNRGYIGLLMLLIGVAIIALLMVRTDIFTGQKDGKNMYEQGTDVIDQSNDVKNMLEQNSRQSVE
ncbi:hypothetical protein A2738_00405 [Candidatus Nomurabacteria bacterium RIFCSPHIGHO2_01_FULL_42_15]|uniref:Uncharacterized protein n=1 Tax=Candidatus Nomurabacteria bacterium RIFCSPHIGHO2_01_FULL_42_15 TaxID=1801742 RepID=A0A1F6VEJ7_9BACT|nr:MAG: hypothetical protein A2738_00405 [Candidatus Nomurabacteria bacterium RIFCSPHIGHO2_01_FULL_42_15]OGI93276.1 MAG: hypothetical protein A3A99_03990 [Candidatus Nomurabacteria bacterium RIFCSPLOWO2_01_FULL_41_18]